jgi:transketolase
VSTTQATLDWTATGERLAAEGVSARVVSMPWRLFTGEAGASIGVDHFGASAGYTTIYREFGITAERVAAAARDSLARV